jgi:biotin carboxyl carrier protein
LESKYETINHITGKPDLRFIQLKNITHDHGQEIEEIISHKLPLMVRWGTLFFFIFLLLLVIAGWIISYPDIVVTNGFLKSINAPKEVIARSDGKLVHFFPTENEQVEVGDILGYIESNAIHGEVLSLSDNLDSLEGFIRADSTDKLNSISFQSYLNLGELQNSFQVYMAALQQFSNYLTGGFYQRKKKMLDEDVVYLSRMHVVLLEQQTILSQDLLLADSTFKANAILKDQKVISSFDYRNERSKMLAKKMTLPQIASSIIRNENEQHDKQKEIAELENQIRQQKNVFEQALHTFKSSLDDWKKQYLLIAPISGRLSFATFLQENQQVKVGQLICFINPGNTDYYIEAIVPQYNFGKICEKQSVRLKFAAYPFQEFGTVHGIVSNINSMPSDSGYLAKIILPEGLVTNYKKNIHHRSGLTVHVEIITKNKRLLQRLFENFLIKTGR